jgi:2-polyprenyl-3-methyl-5-hydroxy-6-metoxy-1,4-benzoquinol methylase
MRSVPQSKYDTLYFTSNCEGYTADGQPGRRLLTLLGHMSMGTGGRQVLDMGCGRGEVAKYLGERGYSVLSMDYSYAALDRFKQVNDDKYPFVRHDLSQGSPWLRDGCFDYVIMADVIEHLYSEQLTVVAADAVRVCKPDALILIDTPIMRGGESALHVDIKESAQEVHRYFPGTELVGTNWHKKPEHCNIILRRRPA